MLPNRHSFILVLTLLQILSAVFLPLWMMLDQNRDHVAAHWLQQNHHHDNAGHAHVHADESDDREAQQHLMLDEFSNNPPDLVAVYQLPSLLSQLPPTPRFTLLSTKADPDGLFRPPRLSC